MVGHYEASSRFSQICKRSYKRPGGPASELLCTGGSCLHPTPTIACLHDSHKHDIGTNGQVTGRVLRNEQREVRIP
jgi:hypothetical protein